LNAHVSTAAVILQNVNHLVRASCQCVGSGTLRAFSRLCFKPLSSRVCLRHKMLSLEVTSLLRRGALASAYPCLTQAYFKALTSALEFSEKMSFPVDTNDRAVCESRASFFSIGPISVLFVGISCAQWCLFLMVFVPDGGRAAVCKRMSPCNLVHGLHDTCNERWHMRMRLVGECILFQCPKSMLQ
jgi:hypothetical protein